MDTVECLFKIHKIDVDNYWPQARENASDHPARENVSRNKLKAKLMQSRITFDTQLKIALLVESLR